MASAHISKARIARVEQLARAAEWVEFTRRLPDGRHSIGLLLPEDILGLVDLIEALRERIRELTEDGR